MTFMKAANISPAVNGMASKKLNGQPSWESQPLSLETDQDLGNAPYENLRTDLDHCNDTFWCHMKPVGRPSYTHDLMKEIGEMQSSIATAFAKIPSTAQKPFSWFVMASEVPGIFNLGGDLGHFAQRIRERRSGSASALRPCRGSSNLPQHHRIWRSRDYRRVGSRGCLGRRL